MKPEGKIMYRPLNKWKINQHFGENSVCISKDPNAKVKYKWCDGHNPPQGWRSIYGDAGHRGIDLQSGRWNPCYAAQRGKVVHIDKNEKTGFDVRIQSTERGFTFKHIYEHLEKWNVEVGQEVKTGQLIGWTGNTGYSTGPHLHYQCEDAYGKPFDPAPYMYDIPATRIFKMNSKIDHIKQQLEVVKVGITGIKKNKEVLSYF